MWFTNPMPYVCISPRKQTVVTQTKQAHSQKTTLPLEQVTGYYQLYLELAVWLYIITSQSLRNFNSPK